MTEEMISMLDMRILSDPYEEECFLILKSNLPKMKDEDAFNGKRKFLHEARL